MTLKPFSIQLSILYFITLLKFVTRTEYYRQLEKKTGRCPN